MAVLVWGCQASGTGWGSASPLQLHWRKSPKAPAPLTLRTDGDHPDFRGPYGTSRPQSHSQKPPRLLLPTRKGHGVICRALTPEPPSGTFWPLGTPASTSGPVPSVPAPCSRRLHPRPAASSGQLPGGGVPVPPGPCQVLRAEHEPGTQEALHRFLLSAESAALGKRVNLADGLLPTQGQRPCKHLRSLSRECAVSAGPSCGLRAQCWGH